MQNKKGVAFISLVILLMIIVIYSFISGSISVTIKQLVLGLFSNEYENVNTIKDLRIPRIIIALLAGAAISVSGLLLQTSLKNPLLDPSIVGVSSGASLFLYLGLLLAPNIIIYKSFFSILGGIIGFLLIYIFSKNIKKNVTIILIGIAISSFFTGLIQLASFFENTSSSLVNARATLGMKSWDDVKLLIIWIPLLLVIAISLSKLCNVFFLEDKVIESLGVNIVKIRILISLLAVILASVATSVVGVVTFLALLTPHIAKKIVGKNHIYSIPFTAILGATIFLLFDTLGRTLLNPIEISADIIMLLVGGPIFLFLIRKEGNYD